MFSISGENMTKRLRAECFKEMLKQDLEWFDNQENNVGALTTRLAVETAAIKGLTGVTYGNTLMILATLGFFFLSWVICNNKILTLKSLGISLGIAFYYSWAISLVIFAAIPLIILSGVLQNKLLYGFVSKDKETVEEAGNVILLLLNFKIFLVCKLFLI